MRDAMTTKSLAPSYDYGLDASISLALVCMVPGATAALCAYSQGVFVNIDACSVRVRLTLSG
eukprot:SAG31_NODE_1020_length_10349_cov_5.621561_9_plen_62_part_00